MEDVRPPDRQCVSCGEVKPAAEFSGQRDKCQDCDRREAEYRSTITRMLDEARPKRAHTADFGWREGVYAWARNHMPNETTLHRRKAKEDVDRAETRSTKRGNNILRSYWIGQGRLFFLEDEGRLPVRVGEDHVRLDAMSAADSRQFAREMRANLQTTYEAGMSVVAAADYLADLATEQGFMWLRQLGNLPPREQEGEQTG